MSELTQEMTGDFGTHAGQQVGRFILQRQLGVGGMGEAWLAVDPQRRDEQRAGEVVLKFLLAELRRSEDWVEEFKGAYRRVQGLNHQHICALYDLGHDTRFGVFQVMQYVRGITLSRHLRAVDADGQGLPLSAVLQVLRPVAQALDYAHLQGLVHRDIKPANLMIGETPGVVTVLDFGLAADLRNTLSLHSMATVPVRGTPQYMAPEQWRGRRRDQRGATDQYAVAVVAWQMLVGEPPYCGDTEIVRLAVLQDPVPELPAELQMLQPVFQRAMAKDWQQRFSSVQEFLQALELAGRTAVSVAAAVPAAGSVVSAVAVRQPPVDDAESPVARLGRMEKLLIEAHGAADQLRQRGKFVEALSALDGLPESLHSQRDMTLYQRCVAGRDQVQQLSAEYHRAVEQLQRYDVRRCLQKLREIQPDEAEWAAAITELERLPQPPQPAPLQAPFDAAAAETAQRAWAWFMGTATEITGSVGQRLRLIPPGTFQMGSPNGVGEDRERPQHAVTLTRALWVCVHPVTQGQWQSVMKTTPWQGQSLVKSGSDVAATYVNWSDATEYCRVLSEREGRRYRLLTEAEWEYACRAGTTTQWSFGDDESQLKEYAWYSGTPGAHAESVGQKRANAFGLFDMHGNVREWCSDWYGSYGKSAEVGPAGPSSGSSRVVRGGCWCSEPRYVRAGYRLGFAPDARGFSIGFRVCSDS